ncbi:hypothetical protein [Nocardia terpenica]|uniref:HK97 gp10 family phage protein n=1 Tax=Nocardia terpenica TaxID=455432 RepID=A0A6G9Z732_9NOCA|nr:hypothetical protein [Nocardia terpenica]QIS21260.1 hypothetical protein F6W96_25965 [Nocardia terpenica]
MRIVFHDKAIKAIRHAPGVVRDLERRAEAVKADAEAQGGEYEVYSQRGKAKPWGRWRTSVTRVEIRSKGHHESVTRGALQKALDAGRDNG